MMTDQELHALNPNSPCEDQLKFWKEQCHKREGVWEANMRLEEENNALGTEVIRLENELEEVRDYLRLLKDERDLMKTRLRN
jgi:predicted nuclease with TOPRIM domain